ncbi:uncharacterized protein BDZ99DRAFT_461454 [Mytilinidion resinicola]|uniref:Histidine kinase HHK12p n=1 Tax=Mytilinidion resinicola TaxID=574789 RepID=A0A6A6YRE7_9PEZI|nr:uncharacterized protein BDZ99DRAFT_461454 [Mytilinidion resinicola]KAF2811370.1 hypothetical protein BDZ99DRAFT_461454 [Mytilinidion resinicola]
MENLDRLTAAGCSLYDLNAEYLDQTDWSQTTLGPHEDWSQTLTCYVNLITTFPHPACVFWGDDLSIIHNLAWGKATGNLDGQGIRAHDAFEGEALGCIKTSVRGHTVKVASRFFLPNTPDYGPEATIIMSTLLESNGHRTGVFAQLLQNATVERSISWAGLSRKHSTATRTKGSGTQQTGNKDHQVDEKQTQLFQRFAELLPNGLAILDSEAEAVFVNDGFFKLTTNKPSKDFRAWPESIDPRDYERVMTAYRRAFSAREELRVEFRSLSEDESEQWRLFLLKPLSEEVEAGFICALVDITEIKCAEIAQEKVASNAQERKEQQERFIDMVSHEIRNPLSAVLHLAEEIKDVSTEISKVVKGQKQQLEDIKDAAETILLCVSHQSVLVDDILSFSKLDSMMLSLIPRVVQPKWAFSTSLKVFNSEFKAKKIEFEYVMDISYQTQEIDYVVADINRIKQVLVNLITNSIKFTARKHGEKKITVTMGASLKRPTSYPPNVVFFDSETEAFHMDSTMSSDWGSGQSLYLMVAIKDTGIGISTENQIKLFERFRQATPKTQEKYGGSGLGLFISRKLCQLHGGDIGVSSKEGEGSTFAFFFKVRRSDGPSESGRPSLSRGASMRSSRTASSSTIPQVPSPRPSQLSPRPSYSRSKSAVSPSAFSNRPAYNRNTSTMSIDTVLERGPKPWEFDDTNESLSPSSARSSLSPSSAGSQRPKIVSISSQPGVTGEDIPKTLKDPPVEYRLEAHPDEHDSDRYEESAKVSELVDKTIEDDPEDLRRKLPAGIDRNTGQSKRQQKREEKEEPTTTKKIGNTKATSVSDGIDASTQLPEKEEEPKPTLLLVEDNLINQKVLKRQLQSRGFVVTTANNGQEAIDVVRALAESSTSYAVSSYHSLAHALPTPSPSPPAHDYLTSTKLPSFSCILMDQEMPVMDGNSATLVIRELMEAEEVGWGPIVGVSANVREEQRSEMLGAGMDEVISKPFKVDELVALVKRVMRKGESLRKAIVRDPESAGESTETLVPAKQGKEGVEGFQL